jgi:hypothetical protein
MQENIDFYYDENGLMVFTKEFLLKRGKCCKNGCKNCPYELYEENINLNKST